MSPVFSLAGHRHRLARAVFAACLQAVAIAALAQDCSPAADADAAAIKARRAAFNDAIATKQIAPIADVLAEDVILVTGTDSDVFRGREAQLAIWRADFASARRAVYVRTTECISVFDVTPIALEYGRWRGVRETALENFATGRYTAKWRRVDGAWRLEAEIFATKACGGDLCPGQ